MTIIKWTIQLYIFLLMGGPCAYAQTITMNFPAFAGKTYELVIFQGSKAEKVIQDTIPVDGKFTLIIPEKYAPYTGMSRWLLTNSEFGGGLDMAIPGHDFSISCPSDKPDNTNIVYTGFDAVNELNRLHGLQQKIIDKFETMSKVTKLYDKSHPLYTTFIKEKEAQAIAYQDFHKDLKKNTNYNARFLPIVNLVEGYAHRLSDNEYEKGQLFNEFFTQKMNIQDLYVSGHWDGIILSWVQMHAQLYKDKGEFVKAFNTISNRIMEPKEYTDFVGKVTFALLKYDKEDFVLGIANTVVSSGKILSYEGGTMQTYVKAMVGTKGPDIIIPPQSDRSDLATSAEKKLSLDSLDGFKYRYTLLVFYQSGCGSCEEVMHMLPTKYGSLSSKGVQVISISADETDYLHQKAIASFPWNDKICDFKGKEGINFVNYAVIATPTMVLLNNAGIIQYRGASLEEILKIVSIEQ